MTNKEERMEKGRRKKRGKEEREKRREEKKKRERERESIQMGDGMSSLSLLSLSHSHSLMSLMKNVCMGQAKRHTLRPGVDVLPSFHFASLTTNTHTLYSHTNSTCTSAHMYTHHTH